MSKFKYLYVLILPILVWFSFHNTGWITFIPLAFSFGVIPLLELAFKPNAQNLTEEQEEIRAKDPFFDLQIYLMVPIQWFLLYTFIVSFSQSGLATVDIIGRISAMGLMCGVIGINVAHELGHRKSWYEQLMAKSLLLTSLYMHFFIEHNKGHHRNVSTKEDPSSARYSETLYGFWIRSVVFAYLSAWKLEMEKLKKKGKRFLSIHNEMLIFQFLQIGLTISIGLYFGWTIMGYFIAAAVMGFLLLETVNYIEHYGLERDKKGNTYERVMPHHSWNSNHLVGRVILFELSRHSDHHYIASRKYQILRHMVESPQMPTGYPGMMLMSTIPPLWFYVMNKRIKKMQKVGFKQAA